MRRTPEPIDDSERIGDRTDHPEGADVGSTAELDRVRSGPDHPDPVPVLVAEEGQRTHRLGLRLGRLLDDDVGVAQHVGVHEAADRGELLGRDRRGVAEVEPEMVGSDQRALLAHVVAEHGTERRLEEVGAGVVAPERVAADPVDGRPARPARRRSRRSAWPGAR